MFYIFLHIWPWVLAALALGAFTGIFAGRLTAQPIPLPKQRAEAKKVVVKETAKEKEKESAAPPPLSVQPVEASDQVDAFQKQLAARDAAIADLRAGLDREVALRRAAIARLEGMMVEQQAQAPTRPIKGGKASAKSSPSN